MSTTPPIATLHSDITHAARNIHLRSVNVWRKRQKRTVLLMTHDGLIYAPEEGSREHSELAKGLGTHMVATIDPHLATYSKPWLAELLAYLGLTKPRMVG